MSQANVQPGGPTALLQAEVKPFLRRDNGNLGPFLNVCQKDLAPHET